MRVAFASRLAVDVEITVALALVVVVVLFQGLLGHEHCVSRDLARSVSTFLNCQASQSAWRQLRVS